MSDTNITMVIEVNAFLFNVRIFDQHMCQTVRCSNELRPTHSLLSHIDLRENRSQPVLQRAGQYTPYKGAALKVPETPSIGVYYKTRTTLCVYGYIYLCCSRTTGIARNIVMLKRCRSKESMPYNRSRRASNATVVKRELQLKSEGGIKRLRDKNSQYQTKEKVFTPVYVPAPRPRGRTRGRERKSKR